MQRPTVRDRLTVLETLGFLQRRQGSGTFLSLPNSQFLQFYFEVSLKLGFISIDQMQGALEMIGLEMVAKQFQEFLTSVGVETIDAEGQPFDHNLHEAVAQEASETVPEGVVIRQLRKGYKLRDRLIRAANVFVSKGKE